MLNMLLLISGLAINKNLNVLQFKKIISKILLKTLRYSIYDFNHILSKTLVKNKQLLWKSYSVHRKQSGSPEVRKFTNFFLEIL